MEEMFTGCSDLLEINFGNFAISSVENMDSVFYNCKSLISIDLSKFDTSKVTTMASMFYGCSKLKYLDLSNFQTQKVNTISSMFSQCKSLIYLNIYSFKLDSSVMKSKVFYRIYSYVKYCLKDEETKNYLLGKNTISVCSDTCFDENNKKIDITTQTCVASCSNDKYEFNNVCYKECPNNTYIKFYEDGEYSDNKNECFENPIQGYYLDINAKVFKKCFKNCKFCYGKGYETINNYEQCIYNFVVLDESKYGTNCYEKCNYYYYFDELDEYHCVEQCPEKYNKIITINKKCIDYCKNDNTYRYEFNNTCYSNCPLGTYILEDKGDYLCLNESPGGYYLDTENNIYKRCFESCKKCNIGGNEIINNCTECKSDYSFYKNKNDIFNCYKKCDLYHYFDETDNFHCSEKCPQNYNLMEEDKNVLMIVNMILIINMNIKVFALGNVQNQHFIMK